MNGEVASWHTGAYSNGCNWSVSLNGDDVNLNLHRAVPMTGSDAERFEEFGDEDAPRDADELYEDSVENAAEALYLAAGSEVVDTRDRPLSFGDESLLVVTDIDYGGTSGTGSQSVTLVVREGNVVSRLSFHLPHDGTTVDMNEAEALLSDAAADVFG